ncbi:hypothetical protein LTR64_003798 [Lithohypha guttulata]|uniref:uncharacterized protein n=1 Tax=Lithohypha guttulata TaxID=1690604 RepID=UPI002DDF7392|nr:hypothetical protein LTR51_006836 [Lithohypha guttulata]
MHRSTKAEDLLQAIKKVTSPETALRLMEVDNKVAVIKAVTATVVAESATSAAVVVTWPETAPLLVLPAGSVVVSKAKVVREAVRLATTAVVLVTWLESKHEMLQLWRGWSLLKGLLDASSREDLLQLNLVTSRPLAQLRLSTLQTRTALPPPSVVGPELFTLFRLCSSSTYMKTSQPRPDPIEINFPDELRPMATLNP